jgi:hypothetical protein
MFHQKADGIATPAATETFIYFLCRGNGKGGSFFIVKRTETQVIGSPFFQFHKSPDDLCDIDPAQDLLYGLLRNQVLVFSVEFNLKKASLQPLNQSPWVPRY